jgi:tetratricopeptide (TPR) repeat protein
MDQGLEALWRYFSRLDSEGSFNRLIIQTLRHSRDQDPDFLFIATHVAKRIAQVIRSHGHLIAPENVQSLASLPPKLLSRSGLDGALVGYQPAPARPAVGRIAFAAVTEFDGYVRELAVTSGRFSEMPKERRDQLDRVGAATVSVIGRRLGLPVVWDPRRYSFWVFDPLGREDGRVDGNSMDLPLALALYSHLTRTPVPTDVSASAEVCRDGTLRTVESIDKKIEALSCERPQIRKILFADHQKDIPEKWGFLAQKVSGLKQPIELAFPDTPEAKTLDVVLNIDSAAAAIQDQYEAPLIDTCLQNANQLIAFLENNKRTVDAHRRLPALFTAYWRKGCCHCHKGEVPAAFASLRKAERIFRSRENKSLGIIGEDAFQNLRINYAVTLKDVFQYQRAEQLHQTIDNELKGIKALGVLHGKNLSSLSQLYLSVARFADAEALQKKAIPLIPEKDRWRNLGLLAQIYTRWGDFDKARRIFLREKSVMEKARKSSPFFPYMQAEYIYRRNIAKKHIRAKDFEPLHAMVENEFQELAPYPVALIHKYDALAYLAEGDEKKGLDKLESVARYLESVDDPLLAATAWIERALYLLKNNRVSEARINMKPVAVTLDSRAFKHYFGEDNKTLKRFLRTRTPDSRLTAELCSVLEKVLKQIPY